MRFLKRLFTSAALTAALSLPFVAVAQTPKPADGSSKDPAKTKTKTSKAATPAPTDAEIADAKSKGMVWVNLNTKVYHKSGQYYGHTKEGKFMTEADAQKAGYREAKEPAVKTKKPAATTPSK